ncbi:hypothetical protein NQZ68_027368 [Dissostichus eleginoides]|nr:hypothetical protein NQZ68_027368 [Dissostichus eleginoides]
MKTPKRNNYIHLKSQLDVCLSVNKFQSSLNPQYHSPPEKETPRPSPLLSRQPMQQLQQDLSSSFPHPPCL